MQVTFIQWLVGGGVNYPLVYANRASAPVRTPAAERRRSRDLSRARARARERPRPHRLTRVVLPVSDGVVGPFFFLTSRSRLRTCPTATQQNGRLSLPWANPPPYRFRTHARGSTLRYGTERRLTAGKDLALPALIRAPSAAASAQTPAGARQS